MSDLAKYEKARELKKHIGRIRADYMKGMKNPDMEAQQKASSSARRRAPRPAPPAVRDTSTTRPSAARPWRST